MQSQHTQEVILLIGGAGLIGASVAELLASQGHQVIVYDAFQNYFPANPKLSKFLTQRMIKLGSTEVIRGNITHEGDLVAIFNERKPTYIVNLACMPMAEMAETLFHDILQSTLVGNSLLLENIRKHLPDLKRYLYISSSMVYGDFQAIPCPEDHPLNPKGVYGAFKKAAEGITQAYGKRYDIPYSIIRPSSVYGLTDTNIRVLQKFIMRALEDKPMIITHLGRLDFTYVDDCAQGIVDVLLNPKGANEIFNITYGRSRSLEEAAQIIQKIIPKAKYETLEIPDDHKPNRGTLDISKASELVRYSPKIALEEGLELYVNHYTFS